MAPALHALIVGVSAYPHLPGGNGARSPDDYGMRQLSASASSAASIMQWLEAAADRLVVSLGSRRLLLSPSPGELDDRPDLAEQAGVATRENFRTAALEWREECADDRNSIAFFYFAGHGVQRTRSDAVLLMRDFTEGGGNPLYNAVDVNNLFGGMAPTARRPDMARTQLWFVDACRGFPSAFDNFQALRASEAFEVELSDRDDRCAPIYFGALPGSDAYSITGRETLFSKALFESLRDAGGERAPDQQDWRVTIGSLLRGMQATIDAINAEEGSDQAVWDGGQTPRPGTPILKLDHVPEVRVQLELRPAAAVDQVALAVQRPDGSPVPVPSPLNPNPFATRWPAGVYRMGATPQGAGIDEDLWPVMPPAFPWSGEVTA
jgi:hypothetical protein